ncbi:MAG: outer membrane lipoprotein-sorting protein [bacterium]
MKQKKPFMLALVVVVCLLSCAATAGDLVVYDKSNYQELKGLVPDPVLTWVEKGDFIFRVGELEFDWANTQPSWVKESRTENVGKYGLSDKVTMVDAKTGVEPEFIKGLPFPDIDSKDPMAPAKIMFNGNMVRQAQGPLRTHFRLTFMNGKTRKLERYIAVDWFSWAFVGWGPALEIAPNPDRLEFYNTILIKEPYDMEGTALLQWRYLDNRPDMLFGYVPAIRRVRRLTPASRSDAMFGSDFARDDGGYVGYDGKIGDVEWKLVGETTILGGFNSAKPQRIQVNSAGEWVAEGMTDRESYAAYGYEPYAKKYYKGDVAPWCATNAIWTKRPVWVIEGRHKDAYYNYGRQIHWVDKETFTVYWKQIFDKSDEYWKMYWVYWGVAATDDGKEAACSVISGTMDERRQHASFIDGYCDDCFYIYNAKTIDLNMFSQTGFTKMSK